MSDLKHAFHSLATSPGFTLVVVLTLALGIGVNTSMYTLVDVLLFRTVPFAAPDRPLGILGTNPQTRRGNFSFAEIDEMRAQTAGSGKAIETLTAYSYWNNTLADPGRSTERLLPPDATEDFFTSPARRGRRHDPWTRRRAARRNRRIGSRKRLHVHPRTRPSCPREPVGWLARSYVRLT